MWCWHKYSKWLDVEDGILTKDRFLERISGYFIKQERRCEKCGKVKVRIESKRII